MKNATWLPALPMVMLMGVSIAGCPQSGGANGGPRASDWSQVTITGSGFYTPGDDHQSFKLANDPNRDVVRDADFGPSGAVAVATLAGVVHVGRTEPLAFSTTRSLIAVAVSWSDDESKLAVLSRGGPTGDLGYHVLILTPELDTISEFPLDEFSDIEAFRKTFVLSWSSDGTSLAVSLNSDFFLSTEDAKTVSTALVVRIDTGKIEKYDRIYNLLFIGDDEIVASAFKLGVLDGPVFTGRISDGRIVGRVYIPKAMSPLDSFASGGVYAASVRTKLPGLPSFPRPTPDDPVRLGDLSGLGENICPTQWPNILRLVPQ